MYTQQTGTKFDGTVTSISYGAATLHVNQDVCGVIAMYDGRSCEVCALYKQQKTGFTQFVSFLSEGHMRDFESREINKDLDRIWCLTDDL